ncbi:MAG: hypothetical protein B5M51_00685 [Anaerolinea sp. 4484_236]|nr:MAG: hypothetical protein B5M51_00685 [Anaerolinea sp. 4484_236]
MRYIPSGQAVTKFSVATNRQYTNNAGERIKETTWFRVNVWGKQAEACNQYLRKGSKVLVEGRMQQDKATGGPRIWTGNDGSPRASFEMTAQTVRFLSSRQEDQQAASSGGGYGASDTMMAPPPDEDIPF